MMSASLTGQALGFRCCLFHGSFRQPERSGLIANTIPVMTHLHMTSIKSLDASCDMVLSMIDTIENNRVPINRFKGEVFCSRFGMSFEESSNPEAYRALFHVMDLIDGNPSVAQIANRCGISFETTSKIIKELYARGLVD